MKNYLIIIFFFLSNFIFAQNDTLFRIVENHKIGFINKEGKTIIPAIYREAGDFSEGLASFRINGKYGFINTKNEIIIPAIYDFVGDFKNGIADVYINDKVTFINQKGMIALPENFNAISFIDDVYCVFTTIEKTTGIYNYKKSSIVFEDDNLVIGNFKNGVAIVKKNKKKITYGVINKKGHYVVKRGVYSYIEKFVNGYARVKLNDSKSKDDFKGVINTEGVLLFKKKYPKKSYITQGFHDGFAAINLYKYWIPEEEGVSYSSEKSYQGFINLKGEIVFNDTLIETVKNFSNKRAFIQEKNGNYNVINTHFKILNKQPFKDIKEGGFVNGHAIVQPIEGCWGIIDTDMKYVVAPEYDNIHEIGILNNIFLFQTNETDYLYGIKTLDGRTITKPIIQNFDRSGFRNGLLTTSINHKLTYLNKEGVIVWQEKLLKSKNNTLNITYMNRGYFRAYSKTTNSSEKYGGWAVSKNEPKPLYSKNTLKSALLVEKMRDKIFIKNYTKDTIAFNSQDSRLPAKLQAKNEDGQWKDIEYLPSSWCGNSYHTTKLPINHYWTFDIPTYEGEFETLIRVELEFINPVTKKENKVYSNTFKGSVNPGQFWRKQSYSPRGIMDPYSY